MGPPLQCRYVANASGQLCRAVIIDISVRRQLEMDHEIQHTGLAARAAKLEHANHELEEANIELEAFNYTVSHDLCSPLTSIKGFAQIFMRIRHISPKSFKFTPAFDTFPEKASHFQWQASSCGAVKSSFACEHRILPGQARCREVSRLLPAQAFMDDLQK